MIILDATTKSLQLKLSGAVATNQLPFAASYVDSTAIATAPGEQDGASNNTTAVSVVSAPAASTQRLVKNIVIRNADTTAATVTIIYNNNSTPRNFLIVTLAVGDQLVYEDGRGWANLDQNGNTKTSDSGNAATATALQTPRAVYGNNFDGTAALTQIIASTYGGTGNGFFKVSGPTISEKTLTIPDANMTVTSAAATVLDDTTVAAMVNTLGGAASTGTGGLVRKDNPTFTGGGIEISGNSSNAAFVRLYEDTDEGGNFVQLFAPASITTNYNITLPAATDTLVAKDTTDTLKNKTLTAPVIATLANNSNAQALPTLAGSVPILVSAQNGGNTNNSSSGSGSDFNHNLTYAVPANYLVANKVIRVTAHLLITTGAAAPTIVCKLKAGSITLSEHGATAPGNSISNDSYGLIWILQGTAAAGASANTYTAMISSGNGPANVNQRSTTDQPVALATNGTLVLTIATLWGSAGTGTNTVQLAQLIVEALN